MMQFVNSSFQADVELWEHCWINRPDDLKDKDMLFLRSKCDQATQNRHDVLGNVPITMVRNSIIAVIYLQSVSLERFNQKQLLQ